MVLPSSQRRKDQELSLKDGKIKKLNASNEKLRKKLDAKDCFFGILDTKKFSGLTVKCSKFSIIFKIKKSLLTLFVTKNFIFILDSDSILLKKSLPSTVYQFINASTTGRKLIITKLKSTVKCVLKICLKFLIFLYKHTTIDTVISLLNLILI